MQTIDLAEGWTGPVPLTLEENGAGANLSNLTLTASLHDRDGNEVATAGDVEITDEDAGEIEWTPDAADLEATKSPYTLRFWVEGADGVVPFPHGEAMYVNVWP